MPEAITTNITSRRTLLGALAATPLAAVPAALAAAPEIDPHVAWGAEALRFRLLLNGPARLGIADIEAIEAAETETMFDLEHLAAETPAATLAGVREQLRLAHYCAEEWDGDRNNIVVSALRNAVATLDQLGGRA